MILFPRCPAVFPLLLIFCLAPVLLRGQPHSDLDTITFLDGTSFVGRISVRQWRHSPQKLRFRRPGERKRRSVALPNVATIKVAEGAYFQRFEVTDFSVDLRDSAARSSAAAISPSSLLLQRVAHGHDELYRYRFRGNSAFFIANDRGLKRWQEQPALPRFLRAEKEQYGEGPVLDPAILSGFYLEVRAGVAQHNFSGRRVLQYGEEEYYDYNLRSTGYRLDADFAIKLFTGRSQFGLLSYVVGATLAGIDAREDHAEFGGLRTNFNYTALRFGFRYDHKINDRVGIYLGRSVVSDNVSRQGFDIPNTEFGVYFITSVWDMPREYYLGVRLRSRLTATLIIRSQRDVTYCSQAGFMYDGGQSLTLGYRL